MLVSEKKNRPQFENNFVDEEMLHQLQSFKTIIK